MSKKRTGIVLLRHTCQQVYELTKLGIPHTLITDSMAAILMKQGKVGLAIVTESARARSYY